MTRRRAAPTALPTMIRPRYGSASLADLLPSIGAHLGVPGGDDVLRLPGGSRFVVVLIDGLGWNLVRRSIPHAPYLASLLGDAQELTSGVPSTTATSLASLGTGLVPGQHGVVGYTSRVPSTGEILNALTWESDLVARAYQAKPTFFERAAAAGVRVTSVALERFQGTGLTEAALRGADFAAFDAEHEQDKRIALTVAAATAAERTLVYAYERQLDHEGHGRGCGSRDWLTQLTRIDEHCQRLREALPDDVVLLITGDHGMLDVPKSHHLLVENHPDLLAGVSALAGEGRFRQLYVDEGSPAAVVRRWSEHLGDRAWVRSRDDAIDDDWFGPVDDSLRDRWGDVLVAMRGDWAVMTNAFPRELSLVGMHGSLTADEMLVPLFSD